MTYLARESEDAMRQYLSSSPLVGMYALEHLIQVYEMSKEFYETPNLQLLSKRGWTFDLAVSYARLGNLAERAGEKERASQAFAKALALFRQAGREIKSGAELKEIIQRLDDNARKDLKTTGTEKDQ